MTKVARFSALTLATVALLGFFVAASPAEAFECYRCPTFGGATTPGQWGMGSTCGQAEANAIANAIAFAEAQCDVCWTGNETIVTACNTQNGVIKADATVKYRCAINLCQ
jgi:hypothetical protein